VVEKLNIVTTSIDNLKEVRGHFDRLFSHADAAIVRPDRYVFGHTTEEIDLNGLIESLTSKLALI
jgi:ribosomal protein L17